MSNTFNNIVVTVSGGAVNNRPVVDGTVVLGTGGTNNAAVTGVVNVDGGTNNAPVTGVVNVTAGTNSSSATVTGSVVVTGGTNAATVTGVVRVSSGGTQSGAITGSLYIESGGNVAAGTTITSGGNVYAATGVDASAAVSNISNFTGNLVQNVDNVLKSTAYTTGTAGSATTLVGVFYNLETGILANKAVRYFSDGQKTPFSGPAYNLTGDNRAYSWSLGVKGGLYTGTLDGAVYNNGVLTPATGEYLEFVVTNDTNNGKLYKPAGQTLLTVGGNIYSDSALTTYYTGVFTYAGTTYYVAGGSIAQTYRAWTVTGATQTDLYTVANGNVLSSTVYSTSDLSTPFTGSYTYNGTSKYADNGVPQTYASYSVSDDSNSGTLYSAPGFTGAAGEYLYTESSLTNKYTGYYFYNNAPFYAFEGELKDYRAWAVAGETNGGTLYTVVVASLGSNVVVYTDTAKTIVYTGGSFHVGTPGVIGFSRVTTDENGAITAIVAVNHSNSTIYAGTTYYHDNAAIQSTDLVYAGQYTDELVTSLTIYRGVENEASYTRITIDGAGIATVASVDHGYSSVGSGSNTYHYDNQTIAQGDSVYFGRYTDDLYTAGTFTIGTPDNEGYGTVTVSGGGLANVSLVDNNQTVNIAGTTYYYANSSPQTNDYLYTGRYTLNIATDRGGSIFYIGTDSNAGYTRVNINSSGEMTVTLVDHGYTTSTTNGVTLYHDSVTLASDDKVYTGRYTDSLYTNAFTAYLGTDGTQSFAKATQGESAGTVVVTVVNHSYMIAVANYGTIYTDSSAITSGDFAYLGQYTDSKATGPANWSIGTQGQAGYTTYSLGSDGAITVTVTNHSYSAATGIYHDTETVSTGTVLYAGQYTNTYATEGGVYVINENTSSAVKITVGANGAAAVAPINHQYAYGRSGYSSGYADVSILSNGVVMYTGQYTMNKYVDIPITGVGTEGVAGYGTFTTDANGVVTASLVDHQYEYITGGIASDSALPTTATTSNIQVYVNRYSNQPASATSFRVGGLMHTVTITNGASYLTDSASFTGWDGGQLWMLGTQIPGTFSTPSEYRYTCDDTDILIKLTMTGTNVEDKVYTTETRASNAVSFSANVGAYSGSFSDTALKWTVSGGVITAPPNGCTGYAD